MRSRKRRRDSRPWKLRRTGAEKTKGFGIFLGGREALIDDVRIPPAQDFLKLLWDGKVVG